MESFFLLLKLFFDNFTTLVIVTLTFSYLILLNTLFLPTNSFSIFMSVLWSILQNYAQELGGFTSVYTNEDNDYISPRLFQKSAVVGLHEPLFHPRRTVQGGSGSGSPRTEELEDGLSQPFSLASRTDIPPTASSVMLPALLERVGRTAVLFVLST